MQYKEIQIERESGKKKFFSFHPLKCAENFFLKLFSMIKENPTLLFSLVFPVAIFIRIENDDGLPGRLYIDSESLKAVRKSGNFPFLKKGEPITKEQSQQIIFFVNKEINLANDLEK